MSKMEDIKILVGLLDDDVVTESAEEDHGMALVVADRGHVWVGHVVTDDKWVRITNARIVRRWGTENGLNQLANDGPQSNTELDAEAPLVKVSTRALIAIVPCQEEKWQK